MEDDEKNLKKEKVDLHLLLRRRRPLRLRRLHRLRPVVVVPVVTVIAIVIEQIERNK